MLVGPMSKISLQVLPELTNGVRSEHLLVKSETGETKLNQLRRLVTGIVIITLCAHNSKCSFEMTVLLAFYSSMN